MQWDWFAFFAEFSPEAIVGALVLSGILSMCSVMFRKLQKKAVGSLRTEVGYFVLGSVAIFAIIWGVQYAVSSGRSDPPDFSETTVSYQYVANCSPEKSIELTCVALIVSLRNLGEASSVDGYSVIMKFRDGDTLEGVFHTRTVNMIPEDGGTPTPFQPTGTVPTRRIARGEIVVLRFVALFDVERESVNEPGTQVVLAFQDAFGRIYEVPGPVGGVLRRRRI